MRQLAAAAVISFAAVSCATSSSAHGPGEHYGFIKNSKQVWVLGPWEAITPSRQADDVIDQLCPSVIELPHAKELDYGLEYCGAIYSLGDGIYYASYASPLAKTAPVGPSKRKHCIPPREVRDVRGRTMILADYHSHPWSPSSLSEEDRWAENQLWLFRIQFDKACHLQKLIPHLGSDQPGEVYERQGKAWKLIGHIAPADKLRGALTDGEADQ
jgi:proteasome lid subunit RPN8/RPN11